MVIEGRRQRGVSVGTARGAAGGRRIRGGGRGERRGGRIRVYNRNSSSSISEGVGIGIGGGEGNGGGGRRRGRRRIEELLHIEGGSSSGRWVMVAGGGHIGYLRELNEMKVGVTD